MSKLYKHLEFDTICRNIASLAASDVVAERILDTEPTADIAEADKLLTQTGDALYILASHHPSLAFDDIEPIVGKARVGAVLRPSELLKVKTSISALRSIKSCVENVDGCDSLKDITAYVRACDDLERTISNAVENDNDLKDGASEKLYNIRRAIVRANAKIKERLDGYTRKGELSKYLQDNIVTVRDGRYVVPVRSEYRSSVKGLIHDVSSTGATVFIEPFAIVEANNELRTLVTEEQAEIERILAELSGLVASNATELKNGQAVLVECGVIFAKAEYARKSDAYRPTLNVNGKITLPCARHPLIARDSVVPVDISLDKRILLISGPNTGGKTVVLKTVGLFALMAACGIFLPAAENSEMCVFEQIYCDIGDSQSIEQSLSTFSAHVTNISDIVSRMNERSLVLLDEVGDGTDPDEGAALAVAILKKILSTRSTAVVTTHFDSVKEFAIGNDEIANACMQFDTVDLKPTYKLLSGITGSSYALEIAEKLGLDRSVIADARAALSKEKIAFDEIMRKAESLRNEIMAEKAECDALKREAEQDAEKTRILKERYERKNAELDAEARSVIRRRAAEYSELADGIIEEIKEKLKHADESALFEARKAAKRLADGVPVDIKTPLSAVAPPKPDELSDGMRVYVTGLDKEGIVCGKPRKNTAIVAIGSIKTELPVSSLTIIGEQNNPKFAREDRDIPEPVNIEIMMRGFTVDEAIESLERTLADIPSKSTLRVVHGKGTGALGKGIQNYLRKQPRVKAFRYGGYGEGDSGVTIVTIK